MALFGRGKREEKRKARNAASLRQKRNQVFENAKDLFREDDFENALQLAQEARGYHDDLSDFDDYDIEDIRKITEIREMEVSAEFQLQALDSIFEHIYELNKHIDFLVNSRKEYQVEILPWARILLRVAFIMLNLEQYHSADDMYQKAYRYLQLALYEGENLQDMDFVKEYSILMPYFIDILPEKMKKSDEQYREREANGGSHSIAERLNEQARQVSVAREKSQKELFRRFYGQGQEAFSEGKYAEAKDDLYAASLIASDYLLQRKLEMDAVTDYLDAITLYCRLLVNLEIHDMAEEFANQLYHFIYRIEKSREELRLASSKIAEYWRSLANIYMSLENGKKAKDSFRNSMINYLHSQQNNEPNFSWDDMTAVNDMYELLSEQY